MGTTRLSVSLTERQIDALEAEARRIGISIAEVIRRWLDERIDCGKVR